MATVHPQPDLWSLVRGTPWIDPDALLPAIERECREPSHDFRTKLLLRDAFIALRNRDDSSDFHARLSLQARRTLDRILSESLGEPGFPSLERRMARPTDPKIILEFLREVGTSTPTAARLDVGGSTALILRGLLTRGTDDIDVVDEVPAPVRLQYELLDSLVARYGLRLTHFQSHYLPTGWESRVESLGRFGKLDVFLVHPVDIFVGKLFSKRTKDRDDLRMLLPALDRGAITERLKTSAAPLLADPGRKADAEKNWYIVFGDVLPV